MLIDLVKKYITKYEYSQRRQLKPFDQFILKDFAAFLQKEIPSLVMAEARAENVTKETKEVKKAELIPNKIEVALITEDIGHLTGGRYYAWFIALALVEVGYKVTIYTNREPTFKNEFDEYKKPNMKIVAKERRELETFDVKADIYIGSPISGNIAAIRLGEKYKKPSFVLIFDPFPMMDKYIGKRSYSGWNVLVDELKRSNTNIISLCKTTSKYIYDWLGKRKDQVFEIYPCVNSRERDRVEGGKKDDYVVFISRLVNNKNFDHVLYAIKKTGVKLKVISSVDGVNAFSMVQKMGLGKQVDFHFKASDREKFEIIKNSRGVIGAATFEGFGMYVIEALSCGIPFIGYEYPTIKEIKNYCHTDKIHFAKWGSKKALAEKLEEVLKKDNNFEPIKMFDFEAMTKRVKEVFKIEPRIGVITIALNEEQYIGASLKSVIKNPNVKKVAVVEGAVNLFSHACDKDGLSIDKTKKEVNKVMNSKNGHKIIYDRYGWATGKSELRNRALTLLGSGITHVLVVDADEVWAEEDLNKLIQEMRENPLTGVFLFPFYHFWKKRNLIAVGGQWDNMLFRCFRYADKTLHWVRHELPVVNSEGWYIHKTHGIKVLNDIHIYHYGYLKKAKNIKDKLEFYRKRDTRFNVIDTWSNWRKGQPTQPTHGGGTVAKFKGKHPPEVKGII